MQANTIIAAALRKLLIIQAGKTPSANQYTVGLEALNDLVKSWSADNDLIYEDTFEELSIPSSTQSFTIGLTGDQVTNRPVEITLASIKENSNERPLAIMDEVTYQRITDKTVTGNPCGIYYRNTWPNGTIYFDHTLGSAHTLILTSLKQLSEFPDGTTEVSLPDYYERALKTNLVLELADEMGAGKRVSPTMINSARESKKSIVGRSIKIKTVTTEVPRGTNIYSIETDS